MRPPNLKAMTPVAGCMPEIDGKVLLLKTHCVPWLQGTGKSSWDWSASYLPDGWVLWFHKALCILRGQFFYRSCVLCYQRAGGRHTHGCNRGITVRDATKYFLVGGNQVLVLLARQRSVAGAFSLLRGKPPLPLVATAES